MERWTEHDVELRMGLLLRAGVLISAALMAVGGVIYLMNHGYEQPEYGTFRGEPDNLRGVSPIFHGAIAGRGRGLMQLAVLVMIATPVMRVAFSVYAFARQHDWMYVAVSLTVLALLLYGLIGGQ
jgi:uncharacterized membrane protein